MRIITYNIHGGIGIDGKRDIDRLISVIQGADADVICLQEVYRRIPNPFYDIVSVIGRKLNSNALYTSAIGLQQAGYGLLTLIRYNINNVKHYSLPSYKEQRKFQVIDIAINNRHLNVVNTHLGLKREERIQQAQYISQTLVKSNTPLIIAGDFNEPAESDAVQHLIKSLKLNWVSSKSGWTFPSNNPTHAIDMVLASEFIINYRSIPYANNVASDHLPVLVELDI